MGLGSFLKKIKKKVTIKSVIKGAAVIGGALPVVGGLIQSVANNAAAAKEQATQAQAAAAEQLAASAMSGTVPTVANAPPTRDTIPMWMIAAGAGVALLVFMGMRKR